MSGKRISRESEAALTVNTIVNKKERAIRKFFVFLITGTFIQFFSKV
jgi:hypothetical protein